MDCSLTTGGCNKQKHPFPVTFFGNILRHAMNWATTLADFIYFYQIWHKWSSGKASWNLSDRFSKPLIRYSLSNLSKTGSELISQPVFVSWNETWIEYVQSCPWRNNIKFPWQKSSCAMLGCLPASLPAYIFYIWNSDFWLTLPAHWTPFTSLSYKISHH